jgi:hypothetical protein
LIIGMARKKPEKLIPGFFVKLLRVRGGRKAIS